MRSELGTPRTMLLKKTKKLTFMHERSCVPPAAFVRYLPALQAVHTDAPLAENHPLAQAVHTDAAVAVKVPLAH